MSRLAASSYQLNAVASCNYYPTNALGTVKRKHVVASSGQNCRLPLPSGVARRQNVSYSSVEGPKRLHLRRTLCQGAGSDILPRIGGTAAGGWSVLQSGDQREDSLSIDLNVVLVEPKIPGNTGAIARTCAAAGAKMHLVKPLGYEITDAALKRAGLDYWPFVVVKVHDSWDAFMEYFLAKPAPRGKLVAFSKKGAQPYTEIPYQAGDWLLFGSETDGLPPRVIEECSQGDYAGGIALIPISEKHVRSLNLSVAAGIGLYEAIRQVNLTSKSLV